jgi:hypothetical protein
VIERRASRLRLTLMQLPQLPQGTLQRCLPAKQNTVSAPQVTLLLKHEAYLGKDRVLLGPEAVISVVFFHRSFYSDTSGLNYREGAFPGTALSPGPIRGAYKGSPTRSGAGL